MYSFTIFVFMLKCPCLSQAMDCTLCVQQFDTVLHALEEGKPIDLSNMPPPLPGASGERGLS